MIEPTDFHSQQNSPCVREFEDDLYDNKNGNICGEVPCSPAYENMENLKTAADVEDDISASDTQKVENKVTCCFAETASTDVPLEEVAEAPLDMAPPLSQACNTLRIALITNIPQELHELPFTSESTHLALGPQEVEIAQATSSEIPSVFAAAPVESSAFEGLHFRETKEEGSYKALDSEAQTSQPSVSDEYHSIIEPRSLMDSTEEALYSFTSERSPEHSVIQCEETPQLRAEIPLKETVTSNEEEEQEEKEASLEEADVIISVQATKPCMEMPKSISNYMDNRQYESENKENLGATDEQHQPRINGQASEDFDNRYAEFVGRVLPGFERYYSKKPNQINYEIGDRPGVLREMQNRELAALPISLYAPVHGHQRAQKRRFLEPEPAINDDYLYPDAVTPSKVEKSLSAVETNAENKENRYDVPFIDDDAFLPRRLRSPSHASTITEDETSSELGYSYGYYEGRYTKAGHLANDDDLKSNQGNTLLFVNP
ncbi:unnamed protein product [Dibothriocephalus latus]|uniref:Uncharacterized protein n=1 Tax=Dibothriocephalus latus TaxID=60516 RepID=A0A3P6UBS1_DIBLA|nr:unnamed protein product [Dibothriocephalus latus]